MVKSLTKQCMMGLVAMLFANLCIADDLANVSLGNCGFAGPEHLTDSFFCKESSNYSSNAVKKQAALQLVSMAWNWFTGAESNVAEQGYLGKQQADLNEGQRLEPKFSLSAHSDELYLTVAYEF